MQHGFESLIVEDESRTIGRIGLPLAWHAQMQQAPIALVEATLEERVEHIHKEYVQDALVEYAAAKLPETDLQAHYEGCRAADQTQTWRRARHRIDAKNPASIFSSK